MCNGLKTYRKDTLIFEFDRFMSLVSHKKSYLECVELSNSRILHNIFIFFSTYKTETANRGQRQLLENR